MRLKGKTAIVTGAAQGIGRAFAERLAQDGANVVVADIQNQEKAASDLKSMGFSAFPIKVDVTSEQETQAMAQKAADHFGGIDILVTNAGLYSTLPLGPFEDISVDAWRKVMDVNTLGVFLSCRAVVPYMKKKKAGRIVNVASGTPFKGVPFLLHYVSSKGAVLAFTKALAKELGPHNILVNCIAPGFTMSDGVLANPEHIEKLRDISIKTRTIQRDQVPADLVGALSFFAGDDSSFVTGQTLVVDGGSYFH
jgi:NAD(P)-dependent dehydrogenase (short-subunit alcohol dehydrogenase family)